VSRQQKESQTIDVEEDFEAAIPLHKKAEHRMNLNQANAWKAATAGAAPFKTEIWLRYC